MLATAGDDQTVRLWEADTGKEVRVLEAHRSGVRAVAFSPDGKALASAGDDQTVRLWDLAAGKSVRMIDVPRGAATTSAALAANPLGGFALAFTADSKAVTLTRIRSAEEARHAAYRFRERVGCESVLITRGEHGMWLLAPEGEFDLRAEAREVSDVTGAGDTVIAAMAIGMAGGGSLEQAARAAYWPGGWRRRAPAPSCWRREDRTPPGWCASQG